MAEFFTHGLALVIGIGGDDLPCTIEDAQGLAKLLKDSERCAYPAAQVQLLTREKADRSAILTSLDNLSQIKDPEAAVVIYFSGHGYKVSSSIGEAYYLLPHGYDLLRLFKTAISGAEFSQKLAAIPAKKMLVLLDCCHAGGVGEAKAPGLEMVKAPLPPEALDLFSQGSGRVLIASSKEDEYSYGGKPYSAFTLALIEALSGKGIAKKDGYVRVADIAMYAREVVPGRTQKKQHPVLHFDQADNFVLAYYAAGETEPKGLPFTVEPEIEPEPGAWSALMHIGDAYHAQVTGGGAVAQGTGARAVGAGGIMIEGGVKGDYVGRDKTTVQVGNRGVAADGNITARTIVAGDNVTLTQPTTAQEKRDLRSWQGEHLTEAVASYLEAQHQLRTKLKAPPLPENPYKGLDYFNPLDRAIFFGRETVADELTDMLLRPENRLVILHAPSGAGKTSLIRAGLIPRLLERGCYCVWSTPVPYPAGIYDWITNTVPGGPEYDDLPMADFLGWVAKHLPRGARLVVFIDQFERIFDPQANISPNIVERDLAACIKATDETLPIRLVLSIRSDFLWSLDKFRNMLPGVLDHRKLLQPLTGEQALQAITLPVQGWPVTWEPRAVQMVLEYLVKGDIEPPHLQLICSQLYEKTIKVGRAIITCGDVKEHDLETLHRAYLRTEMRQLQDEELGWEVLKQLITADGIASRRPVAELETALGEVSPIVDQLIERRVLRRVDSPRIGKQIEIAHETLAKEILAHASPEEIRLKKARELIERGLDDWLSHEIRPLMGPDRLRILDEYRDVLSLPILGQNVAPKRERQALEYLWRSAVKADYEDTYWLNLANSGGVDLTILLEVSKSANFRTRLALVGLLARGGKTYIDLFIGWLSDDYPQVRVAAIHSLEQLAPDGNWRVKLKYECYVPKGVFIMGDDESDRMDEKPAHALTLEAFYIGKYPVTYAAYKRFKDDIGELFIIPEDKADHPVVNVNWKDARDYASWAGMRLPTEAEWEKAASWDQHKQKKYEYPWGDEFDPKKCNTKKARIGDTTPVGNFSPSGDSPYGCVDMAGNVWEWTSSRQAISLSSS